MRAVETNVLVRLLTRDDACQTAAADVFIEKGAWISSAVLVEAVRVPGSVYGLDASAVANAVEMIQNHKDLTLQDSDVVAEALNLFRSKAGLSFSDCLILELTRRAGHLPLGTFDRNLSQKRGEKTLNAGVLPLP